MNRESSLIRHPESQVQTAETTVSVCQRTCLFKRRFYISIGKIFPIGKYLKAEITFTNQGLGACTSINLKLTIPVPIRYRGNDRIEIDRLLPGESRSHPMTILIPEPGLYELRSGNFSYVDSFGNTQRLEGLRIPLQGIKTHPVSSSSPALKTPKEETPVFLCHNNKDKADVKKIAKILKQHGIQTWLDEVDIGPGKSWRRSLECQISSCASAIIFYGPNKFGKVQNEEIYLLLEQRSKR